MPMLEREREPVLGEMGAFLKGWLVMGREVLCHLFARTDLEAQVIHFAPQCQVQLPLPHLVLASTCLTFVCARGRLSRDQSLWMRMRLLWCLEACLPV